jgi:hypothetical protein
VKRIKRRLRMVPGKSCPFPWGIPAGFSRR